MSGETAALLEFVQGVDWNKYKDDGDVVDILTKIKKRVEAIENEGEEEAECGRAKLVIVGDGAVGKTCLLITFKTGNFPEEYVPTVFENYTVETEYSGDPFLLQLWDTAGQEDYDRLRPLSYPGTEVVLLCFSLVNEATFESVREKWNPEINHYLENVPKILVGTKVDLRDANIKDPHLDRLEKISTAEGKALAEEIEAVAYIEASAKTGHNLKLLFNEAIKAALDGKADEEEPPKPKKRSSKKKENKDGKKERREKTDKDGKKKRRTKKDAGEKKEKEGEGEEKPKRRRKTKVENDTKEKGERKKKSSRSRSKTEGGESEAKEKKHKRREKKDKDEKREKKKKPAS